MVVAVAVVAVDAVGAVAVGGGGGGGSALVASGHEESRATLQETISERDFGSIALRPAAAYSAQRSAALSELVASNASSTL